MKWFRRKKSWTIHGDGESEFNKVEPRTAAPISDENTGFYADGEGELKVAIGGREWPVEERLALGTHELPLMDISTSGLQRDGSYFTVLSLKKNVALQSVTMKGLDSLTVIELICRPRT